MKNTDTVESLKNDIKKNEEIVKQTQKIFIEEINNGLFENQDVLLKNPDYFNKTFEEVKLKKENIFKKIINNIRRQLRND